MRGKTLAAPFLLLVGLCFFTANADARGAKDITEASIRGHMEFLASDAMQGRGSGTMDEWRTATYIGSHLRRWGIEPLGDDGGYVQQIDTGRVNATTTPVLVAGSLKLTHGREMLVQSINDGAANGTLFHYTQGVHAPEGSFVLIPEGVTPDPAQLAGAAAMLTLESAQQRSQWAAAGARLPDDAPWFTGRGNAPIGIVRAALDQATHRAIAALPQGAPLDFQVQTAPRYTWNAAGKLTGRDAKRSSEVVLLSAHLDHLGVRGSGPDTIFNGADDDASGTTAVLELAEALAKGKRPKRSVIFVWFGSEEAGGHGARAFLEKPPVPLTNIVANLEFEMIGRADPAVAADTLWLTGYERSNLGATLAKQGARLVQDPHPDQNFFQRSDNFALALEGVIAHTVSSFNLHREYHTATDDLSHIDFAHMTMAIQSMYEPVLRLLDSKFVPSWHEGCRPSRTAGPGPAPRPASSAQKGPGDTTC